MQTIKLKYKTSDENLFLILDYQRQYSSCLHFAYNRFIEEEKLSSMFNYLKSNSFILQKIKRLNNISLMNSWFIQNSMNEAYQIIETKNNKKIIFGGKKNFFQRMKGNITKEDYKILKLNPLYSIGTAGNHYKANRFFNINQELNSVLFKPNRATKIQLSLENLRGKYLTLLKNLYLRQENRDLPITYKLDQNYIYISFDECKLTTFKQQEIIENRILALDLNPNYIGWSITDWQTENEFKVIKSGIYSFKSLNDKEKDFKKFKLNSSDPKRIHLNNKRKFEVLEVSKNLINKALYYKCEIVSFEDLSIVSSDRSKGKNFNRSCNNQWLRNDFVNNLNKRCNIFKIKLLKVKPEYSSFIGNFLYRSLQLPDQILSSIEIGRRAYEFNLQYIKKIKPKKKNIIQPEFDSFKSLVVKSLEEFNIKEEFSSFIDLYYFFKKSKKMYRLSLDQFSDLKFSRFSSKCSGIFIC
jgi:hypothetical protein